jgi:hypothetical protein
MAEKSDKNVVVAVYKDHASGEAAVKELQNAGFDCEKAFCRGPGLSHGKCSE